MPIENIPTGGTFEIDAFGAFGLILQSLGFLVLILLTLGGLAAAAGYVWVLWMRNKDREEHSLDFVLLSVAVPRDNEVKIDAAEQMFSSLASLYKGGRFSFLHPETHFSLEIVAFPEQVKFFISCPRSMHDLVEKQIHGAYPGAEVAEVEEYNIFSENGKLAYASLRLKKGEYYPIKTYKELATDPLSQITSALAKIESGEGAAVQILVEPASSKWRTHGKHYVSKTKSAELSPKGHGHAPDPKKMEAIENKTSKPGFEAVIRIVVSAKTAEEAKTHLDNIKSTFAQFSSDFNGFGGVKIRMKKQFLVDFVYRYMPIFGKKSVLNTEELATLFHLPNKTVETPGIYWVNAKRAPAPAQIPSSGLHLGKSVYRGLSKEIYLSDDDRRRHVYIVGKTGAGKTQQLT
ncbi:MAG: hypothetical protein WD988_00365, partial [Candidatus Curtissbacteria bacterium]